MAAVGATVPDLIDDQIAKTREELIKELSQTDHDQAEARFTAMKVGEGNSSAAISAEADELVAADPGMTSIGRRLISDVPFSSSRWLKLPPISRIQARCRGIGKDQ